MQRSLSEFKVLCVNQKKGCESIGELGALDAHLNSGAPSLQCQIQGYVETECIYCSDHVWCLVVQAHVKEHCCKRPYSCHYYGKYDSDLDVSVNHWPVCGYHPVDALTSAERPSNASISRNMFLDDYLLTLVDCAFKHVSCLGRLPQKDIPAHIAKSVSTLQTTSYKETMTRLEENKKLKHYNKLAPKT